MFGLKKILNQIALTATFLLVAAAALADETVHYRTVAVDDTTVFYREAGARDAPTVLLLHGFGASSFMFRDLIPVLATKYHVLAPDLPGFGQTQAPARGRYKYDFAQLATTIDRFTETQHVDRYAIYVFDYGAPVGFRLALKHPERITAIVSQNGNAYAEGLSAGWDPIRRYWTDPTPQNRAALKSFLTLKTTRWQYEQGVPDPSRIDPSAYILAEQGFRQPGNAEIQLDLFGDYKSNVALYPAFQAYLREHAPPLLAVWGKNDPFFLPAGAEAYRRDDPKAEVTLYDAGHFALESDGVAIGARIMEFLGRVVH